MVHQLPIGAKDLLPLDVAQKRWIESRLENVFQSWGYQRIITPTLERLDTLTAGGAVQPNSVIQMRGNGSEVLGLRPELTASIARAYAPRLETQADSCPQRLYYNANVFRQLPSNGQPGQQEYYQAGVELLGGTGILADGEILLLVADCLRQVELQEWQIVLGYAGLTSALLDKFPAQERQVIRKCIARLDRIAIENLPISDNNKQQALQLLDLRGQPQDILPRLYALEWLQDFKAEIDYLKELSELWQSVALPSSLIIDLSLIQTFDYYTGIVFEVVNRNAVIAQGGRYDRLLGIYHPRNVSYPSIGFSLNLEDLHKALIANLPQQAQSSQWLVVAQTPQAIHLAFQHAAKLRQRSGSPQLVELELEFRDPELVRNYARSRGIKNIAWLSDEKTISEENVL